VRDRGDAFARIAATVGRSDAQPFKAQGILTDPPVSVPSPAVTMRVPIAVAVPDDEPPAIFVES
jgi:hypothetical protein